jgi:SAM-dependent methyltransferase
MTRRPFYAEYAWAFDLLIDRPVRKECAAIVAWLVDRGIRPGAAVLDAGCGTGRYSIELGRRGFIVEGVDLSPALIEMAKASGATGGVSFVVGNIADSSTNRYAAILCRGVLNDIIDDDQCDAVFAAFARALQPNGVLIMDVREWGASAARKTREPLFRKRVPTDRGELTFTSVTTLDRERRRLLVYERHELISQDADRVSEYRFVMRCWERDEMSTQLERHGFGGVQYFGAYDPAVEAGTTDRLVIVARRGETPDAPKRSR